MRPRPHRCHTPHRGRHQQPSGSPSTAAASFQTAPTGRAKFRYESQTDAQSALIYHWNGEGRQRAFPALPEDANTWLMGVVAFSGGGALAAGFAQNLKSRLEFNQQVRWNGKKWTLSAATGSPPAPAPIMNSPVWAAGHAAAPGRSGFRCPGDRRVADDRLPVLTAFRC